MYSTQSRSLYWFSWKSFWNELRSNLNSCLCFFMNIFALLYLVLSAQIACLRRVSFSFQKKGYDRKQCCLRWIYFDVPTTIALPFLRPCTIFVQMFIEFINHQNTQGTPLLKAKCKVFGAQILERWAKVAPNRRLDRRVRWREDSSPDTVLFNTAQETWGFPDKNFPSINGRPVRSRVELYVLDPFDQHN